MSCSIGIHRFKKMFLVGLADQHFQLASKMVEALLIYNTFPTVFSVGLVDQYSIINRKQFFPMNTKKLNQSNQLKMIDPNRTKSYLLGQSVLLGHFTKSTKNGCGSNGWSQ